MNKKPLKHLSFESLTDYLSKHCKKIPDKRIKSIYSMHDTAMSCNAMFMFKDKSMLEFQRNLQEEERRNNLSTLFHVKNIPSDNQIRNNLDNVSPKFFDKVYHEFFKRLQRGKHHEKYQVLDGYYTITIDGEIELISAFLNGLIIRITKEE